MTIETHAPEAITHAKAAARDLHSYISFRAEREGLSYELDQDYFLAQLLSGVQGFFGVELSDGIGGPPWLLERDHQNPEAFTTWLRQRSRGEQ